MSLKYIVVRCFDNRMKEEPNLPLGKIFIPHLEYFISKNDCMRDSSYTDLGLVIV